MKQKRPPAEPQSASLGDDPLSVSQALRAALKFGRSGLGGKYDKSCDSLPVEKQHQLKALGYYYAYTHNGYLLLKALELCKGVNPPVWVLEALTDCFDEFRSGKTLERSLLLGKRHREEYEQFYTDWPVMAEVWKQCQSGKALSHACLNASDPQRRHPESIEKQYRKFWKGFFAYIAGA